MRYRCCVPSLPAFKLSARLSKLWTLSTATHRGSGWVALAVSRCLALGATTSIFLRHLRLADDVSAGLFHFTSPKRGTSDLARQGLGRNMKCDRGAERLERLEHEDVAKESFQNGRRQPAP